MPKGFERSTESRKEKENCQQRLTSGVQCVPDAECALAALAASRHRGKTYGFAILKKGDCEAARRRRSLIPSGELWEGGFVDDVDREVGGLLGWEGEIRGLRGRVRSDVFPWLQKAAATRAGTGWHCTGTHARGGSAAAQGLGTGRCHPKQWHGGRGGGSLLGTIGGRPGYCL